MANRYMSLVGGLHKLVEFLTISTGAADAGKGVATGADGRLDASLMPLGIGVSTVSATASEAIGAGKFVNLYTNAGVLSMRLADNSNGRAANGFVKDAVANAAVGQMYRLDDVNAGLTAMTLGAPQWLGTAGGVISTPLVETDVANANKVSQYLGIAKSATELITEDSDPVTL